MHLTVSHKERRAINMELQERFAQRAESGCHVPAHEGEHAYVPAASLLIKRLVHEQNKKAVLQRRLSLPMGSSSGSESSRPSTTQTTSRSGSSSSLSGASTARGTPAGQIGCCQLVSYCSGRSTRGARGAVPLC